MESRKGCRDYHKELRSRMTAAEVQKKSRAICWKLSKASWYQACTVIYGYYPLGNEADCLPFLKQALLSGKRIALPRTGTDGQMEFYEIRSLEEVKEGRFHVKEPIETCRKLQNTKGVVLVPGTVFDQSGSRYGYGMGYYDRYFSRFPGLLRFALAYENQIEERIETSPTDVKMHRIYTEEYCYEFNAGFLLLKREGNEGKNGITGNL